MDKVQLSVFLTFAIFDLSKGFISERFQPPIVMGVIGVGLIFFAWSLDRDQAKGYDPSKEDFWQQPYGYGRRFPSHKMPVQIPAYVWGIIGGLLIFGSIIVCMLAPALHP